MNKKVTSNKTKYVETEKNLTDVTKKDRSVFYRCWWLSGIF